MQLKTGSHKSEFKYFQVLRTEKKCKNVWTKRYWLKYKSQNLNFTISLCGWLLESSSVEIDFRVDYTENISAFRSGKKPSKRDKSLCRERAFVLCGTALQITQHLISVKDPLLRASSCLTCSVRRNPLESQTSEMQAKFSIK